MLIYTELSLFPFPFQSQDSETYLQVSYYSVLFGFDVRKYLHEKFVKYFISCLSIFSSS